MVKASWEGGCDPAERSWERPLDTSMVAAPVLSFQPLRCSRWGGPWGPHPGNSGRQAGYGRVGGDTRHPGETRMGCLRGPLPLSCKAMWSRRPPPSLGVAGPSLGVWVRGRMDTHSPLGLGTQGVALGDKSPPALLEEERGAWSRDLREEGGGRRVRVGQVGLGPEPGPGAGGCLTYGRGLGAAEGQGSCPAGLCVEPPHLASWGQNSCLKSPVHGTLSGPTQQNQWSRFGGGSVWEGPSGRTG